MVSSRRVGCCRRVPGRHGNLPGASNAASGAFHPTVVEVRLLVPSELRYLQAVRPEAGAEPARPPHRRRRRRGCRWPGVIPRKPGGLFDETITAATPCGTDSGLVARPTQMSPPSQSRGHRARRCTAISRALSAGSGPLPSRPGRATMIEAVGCLACGRARVVGEVRTARRRRARRPSRPVDLADVPAPLGIGSAGICAPLTGRRCQGKPAPLAGLHVGGTMVPGSPGRP